MESKVMSSRMDDLANLRATAIQNQETSPLASLDDRIVARTPETPSSDLLALAAGVAWKAPELAVVVPTYNERENVPELLGLLENALVGVRFEVVIVDDDSPDGTAEVAREMSLTRPWVRVIHRIGRRGLASACLEGMLATSAPAIAVMDADLQHDETILAEMLHKLRESNCDVVVGTRNVKGGSKGEMRQWRVGLSDWGLKISRLVMQTKISDPMSGFFLVDRRFLHEVVRRTSGVGFKILVDLLASAKRPVNAQEVPYRFRRREHGASKLDLNVGLEYLYLLLDKLLGDHIPVRFALYAGVGAVGVGLHLGSLAVLLNAGAGFLAAQLAASGIAMTANFFLNNIVTHRDVRLKGWRQVRGLATFYAACLVGLLTNLSVSERLLNAGIPSLWAGLAGLIVTSVWNYGVTNLWTWRRLKDRALARM